MKIVAFRALQNEIIESVCEGIEAENSSRQLFLSELTIQDKGSVVENCGNAERKYTIAVPFEMNNIRYYYIALKPAIFRKYCCPWFGNVKDCYLGSVTEPGTRICRI